MLDVEVLNSFLAKTKKTRKDIAEQIGMSETSFSQKASGKRAFTVSEALRLAEVTRMPQKTFKEIWKDEK
jgi:antitoxin component HigA of HigAB toxin-antitoxin module